MIPGLCPFDKARGAGTDTRALLEHRARDTYRHQHVCGHPRILFDMLSEEVPMDLHHPDAEPFVPDIALESVPADFIRGSGANLLRRWDDHQSYWDARAAADVDPYGRSMLTATGPEGRARTRAGTALAGVNFASQDYLSLSAHPAVREAAIRAVRDWGVHSAGSLALQGGTAPLLALERRIAEFCRCDEAIVFPTGWGAGYGVIRALVRPDDHVIIDAVAHACLQEGARAATKNVHLFPHRSNDAVERRLARLRADSADAGILVVTETLFSMDSDVPDLVGLQALCDRYGATLLVDVAHDLGAIGPDGQGFLGEQGMLGGVDVVMGSFSKTFASNGGFVASSARGLKQGLRVFAGPLLFSNALSPVQAATVMAALDIIQSPEGASRRRRLLDNVDTLRASLQRHDFQVIGVPSAIVPVILGEMRSARLMTRDALEAGGLVNLVEHPAVSRNSCRWRLQVMADHTPDQIARLTAVAAAARASVAVDVRTIVPQAAAQTQDLVRPVHEEDSFL